MSLTSKRIRSIYSAIASPNRLEMLRLLNSKGPATYSEMKGLSGFKSKQESGKFAYHLRKLVRQNLVTLDRVERKYVITGLGMLLLKLTRQIEEQSATESSKIYVRTSKQTMEEFNADRILQSLVREALMPLDLASRIASEAEARIRKFQTTYLTAPLIREVVNALLIEHGHEEYRHKLTRLGMPVYDVTQLINETRMSPMGVESLWDRTSDAVLSEYLLLEKLSKDVSDAHLSGDIHFSKIGKWGLMPDTIFLDLSFLHKEGFKPSGKLLGIPRISPPRTLQEAISGFAMLISLLSREVTSEVSVSGLTDYVATFASGKGREEKLRSFQYLLQLVSSTMPLHTNSPIVSFSVPKDSELTALALEAYSEYATTVPSPSVAMIASLSPSSTEEISLVTKGVLNGGLLEVTSQDEVTNSFIGLGRNISVAYNPYVFHSISLNLPRLAYESEKDGNYWRARITMLLQTALTAAATRRRIVGESIKEGLLPALTSSMKGDYPMAFAINLIGMEEATRVILGERADRKEKGALAEKALETASRVVRERSEKSGDITGVSLVYDEAAGRFPRLDSEKFGRLVVGDGKSYSYGISSRSDELGQEVLEGIGKMVKHLTGGSSINLHLPQVSKPETVEGAIEVGLAKLPRFKICASLVACRSCGLKSPDTTLVCPSCGSASLHKLEYL